jgi:hypothetical protein
MLIEARKSMPDNLRYPRLTNEPYYVCYFLCKTRADYGERGLGMLVSAAKSNIKVGIQTSSRRSRGKSLTLEELL